MPAKFEGFSLPDQQRLVVAFVLLRTTSGKAKKALMSGDLGAYQKWFDGTGKNAHLMKVSTVVKEIDDAINQRPITFVNATGNKVHKEQQHLCGYVFLQVTEAGRKGVGYTVEGGKAKPTQGWDITKAHFGSGMRVMMVPRTHNGDVNDLAETMYHELSHKVGGTWDVTYSKEACGANARNDPGSAVSNAENYNLFLREFF
jgi:hypothetical protein